ncbi:MAG: hypothetical protein WC050_02745 [Candidatus Paceibacterota bacterium]
MNDFLKMDVFFVVSTLVVVVVGIFLTIVLIRVFRILGYVEELSKTVSDEAKDVRADVVELRAHIRREGFKLRHVGRFAKSLIQRATVRKKRSND